MPSFYFEPLADGLRAKAQDLVGRGLLRKSALKGIEEGIIEAMNCHDDDSVQLSELCRLRSLLARIDHPEFAGVCPNIEDPEAEV